MDKIVVSYEKNRLVAKAYNSFESSSYSNIFFGKEAERFLDKEKRTASDIRASKDGKLLRVVYPDRVIFIKDYKMVLSQIDARERAERYNASKAKKYMPRHAKAKRVSKTGTITKGLTVLLILVTLMGVAHQLTSAKDDAIIDVPSVSATWIDESNKDSIEQYLNGELPSLGDDAPAIDKDSINNQINGLLGDAGEESKELTNGDKLAQLIDASETIEQSFNISFSDRTKDEKAINTKNEYYDIISKYAKMYGVDADLMTAIATQEKGVHSSEIDPGGGIGLMQIQYDVWVGNNVSAYNFDTKSSDTLPVTKDNIGELKTNIKIACMYFQNCLVSMNYNVPAALCAYNWGISGAQTRIISYSEERGLTLNEVLRTNDASWVNLFGVEGDASLAYPKLVLSYYDISSPIINEKIDSEGNEIFIKTNVTSPLIKSK